MGCRGAARIGEAIRSKGLALWLACDGGLHDLHRLPQQQRRRNACPATERRSTTRVGRRVQLAEPWVRVRGASGLVRRGFPDWISKGDAFLLYNFLSKESYILGSDPKYKTFFEKFLIYLGYARFAFPIAGETLAAK